MRRIFGGSIKLGPSLGPAIVTFDLWISALSTTQAVPDKATSVKMDVADFIGSVAALLAGPAHGTERDLLKKAFEETLFIAAGQDTQISPRMAQSRWALYAKAHGQSAMIEMFLANHLWNVLWYGAGDVFGQSDDRAMEYRMRRLQCTCRLLVNAVCLSKGLKDSVSLPVAEQVIEALEDSISPS